MIKQETGFRLSFPTATTKRSKTDDKWSKYKLFHFSIERENSRDVRRRDDVNSLRPDSSIVPGRCYYECIVDEYFLQNVLTLM